MQLPVLKAPGASPLAAPAAGAYDAMQKALMEMSLSSNGKGHTRSRGAKWSGHGGRRMGGVETLTPGG
jgi:hypothetical protein